MNRKWITVFLLITIGWYAATLGTMIFGFSISMSTFDTGEPTPLLGTILITLFNILGFPLFSFGPKLGNIFPGLLGHIPLLLNSAVWGLILTFVIRKIIAWKNARTDQSTQESEQVGAGDAEEAV
jgi:hypothetical protein